jgi:hypothetical protein
MDLRLRPHFIKERREGKWCKLLYMLSIGTKLLALQLRPMYEQELTVPSPVIYLNVASPQLSLLYFHFHLKQK